MHDKINVYVSEPMPATWSLPVCAFGSERPRVGSLRRPVDEINEYAFVVRPTRDDDSDAHDRWRFAPILNQLGGAFGEPVCILRAAVASLAGRTPVQRRLLLSTLERAELRFTEGAGRHPVVAVTHDVADGLSVVGERRVWHWVYGLIVRQRESEGLSIEALDRLELDDWPTTEDAPLNAVPQAFLDWAVGRALAIVVSFSDQHHVWFPAVFSRTMLQDRFVDACGAAAREMRICESVHELLWR